MSAGAVRVSSLRGLAWRNMQAHPARTGLSITAVAMGVALAVATGSLANSIRYGMLKSDEMRALMGGLIDQFIPLVNFISLVVILTAGFLVFNAFSMAVTQRQREIGMLRALGMTRRRIIDLYLLEALLIGGAGTLLGLLAGPLLARLVVAMMVAFGGGIFLFEHASATAGQFGLAAGLGLGITLLAVLIPARRAARVLPLEALRSVPAGGPEAFPVRRTALALALIGGLFAVLLAAPPGLWVTYPADVLIALLAVAIWFTGLTLLLSAVISLTGDALRRPLTRLAGATGRLLVDNFQRERGRVTTTILTLALGLTVISGMSGFVEYMVGVVIGGTMQASATRDLLFVSRLDILHGWDKILKDGLDSFFLAPEESAAIQAAMAPLGHVASQYFVVVPELSFLGSGYFSYMADPDALNYFRDSLFQFEQGGWDSALPILHSGCGVLVAPLVAQKNDAALGDTITVTAASGPVDCTIAGIGTSVANASLISTTLLDAFRPGNPALELVIPRAGVSGEDMEAALQSLQAEHPNLYGIRVTAMMDAQMDAVRTIFDGMSGLLMLAILAAALGVVNTMLMSITERRHEIGLLRAVGATRAQVRSLLLGEAALMGLIAGVIGLAAGVGFVVVFAVTYGGNSWGVSFPLWPTALDIARTALASGAIGLVAAPLVAALAAWLPARRILRETAIDLLDTRRT